MSIDYAFKLGFKKLNKQQLQIIYKYEKMEEQIPLYLFITGIISTFLLQFNINLLDLLVSIIMFSQLIYYIYYFITRKSKLKNALLSVNQDII